MEYTPHIFQSWMKILRVLFIRLIIIYLSGDNHYCTMDQQLYTELLVASRSRQMLLHMQHWMQQRADAAG